MSTIKRTMTTWEKHDHEVEFELPCYRRWKGIRIYKIIDEKTMIMVQNTEYLNPVIELVEGKVDSAFDKETYDATAEEFDEAFSNILSRITKHIHQ